MGGGNAPSPDLGLSVYSLPWYELDIGYIANIGEDTLQNQPFAKQIIRQKKHQNNKFICQYKNNFPGHQHQHQHQQSIKVKIKFFLVLNYY